MTWVDIILFIILIVIIFLCFSAGLIRVASIMLGMYLGLQVAGLFYSLFATITADRNSPASVQTNEVIWFGVLWVVWTIILSLVVVSFTKEYSMPERLGNVDQIGGLLLGIFVGIFGAMIIAFVIRNTSALGWISAGRPNNYLFTIYSGFRDSLLMGVFKTLKTIFVTTLSPWLPKNIPVFGDF